MAAFDLATLPVSRVERVMTSEVADKLVGAVVPDEPATVTTAGLWLDAESGDPVLAYYPLTSGVQALRAAVMQVRYGETMRSGTGLRNKSKTFGMSPRRPTHQREGCRPAGMAVAQPEVHAVIVALADQLTADLRAFAPGQAAHDEDVVRGQVAPEWRMTEQTLWTSGVVNKSSTLPYHRDGFNFEAWSAMPVLRRSMAGGHLSIPEYGLSVGCRDGWVVYFAGWQLIHGVTPMRATADGGYRYSVVYYALRGMKSCFEYAVEVGEARKRRTDREDGMADEAMGKAPPRVPIGKGLPIGKFADFAPGGGGRPGAGQIVV